MHVIGAAGHVDHGKSSLVRALTGTDPDRWAAGQHRGMTLDLSFAHLRFADGIEAAIIDVPGRQRFLHNMLAGAAAVEVVLLVIAADEGPMPQTLEHLAIFGYLKASRVLVVLTKSDTVDAAECARVQARIRATVDGSLAHAAPILAVSTLTGAGLPALREAIHAALVALEPCAPSAPAYLPIDRVVARGEEGTVVTGTLMQGRIARGDTLALSPLGRIVHVRGLHVFGVKRDAVTGGTRVAVNLPDVDIAEIARGDVLASPQLAAASRFAVSFTPQVCALDTLRRRMPVRAYIGAAEILGTLVFERTPSTSAAHPAVLHLRTATIAIPRAPFVVRRVSPMKMLGGGIIIASHIEDETNAADPDAATADERDADAVRAAIAAAALVGATPAQIGVAANLNQTRVKQLVDDLVADGQVRSLAKPPGSIDAGVADDLLTQTLAVLRVRQRERPWLMGATSIALAQSLALPERTLVRVLAVFVDAGTLAYRSGYYATTDFVPQLAPEQRAFFDRAFASEPAMPAAPVPFAALRALIGTSNVVELSPALETLIAGGVLSKVGDFVYCGSHIAAIRAQLESALRSHGQLTVAEFRTLTGTSRKYAVPLLEFFDATGVTIRTGDVRVSRRSAPANDTRGAERSDEPQS